MINICKLGMLCWGEGSVDMINQTRKVHGTQRISHEARTSFALIGRQTERRLSSTPNICVLELQHARENERCWMGSHYDAEVAKASKCRDSNSSILSLRD